MTSFKIIKFLLALLIFGSSLNAHSYQWNQLTEKGLLNKIVIPKKVIPSKESSFADLDIKIKQLSPQETTKKFPALTNPRTIVVLGDTGCRLKESSQGDEYQDCNDASKWPLKKISESASKENPDLIIHLGDYHYREKCSSGKACEKMSTSIGYGWQAWELDFFQPLQKLLEVAPIIIVRGNHEDCNRAFLGYKELLANSFWTNNCESYEAPQLLIFKDLAIIDFDSSSISEIPNELEEGIWVKRFNEIYEKISKLNIKTTWLVTHKPLYGIIPFKFAYVPGNINLRSYFEKSSLKDKVNLLFAGHIHTSMIVVPKKYSKQIVLGNSGTQLDNFSNSIPATLLNAFSYSKANLVNSGFGYAVLKRNDDQTWTIIFKNSEGRELYKDKI